MKHLLTLFFPLLAAGTVLAQGRIEIPAGGKFLASGGKIVAGGSGAGEEVNVNNDGEMDLSGGDVQVFGNVDNDGDMDLSGGDVQVFRAGNPTQVTNGATPTARITISNSTILNIGNPRAGVGSAAGGSGNLVNLNTTAGQGVVNTSTVSVPTVGAPIVSVNGNVDNDGDMDLSGGDVQVFGNVDNDGDMDLSGGDVQVFGNVDNDGDMDLSGGDVQVFRAAATTTVTNGATGINARITISNSTNLNIGMPNTGVGNAAGGSGNLVNVRGNGTSGSLSTTNGIVNTSTVSVPTAGAPAVHVNGNVDNDGDMDLSGGDVQVFGNVDNDGDMDLSGGDVQVFGNVDNDGDMDLSGGDVQVFRAATTTTVTNGATGVNARITISNNTTLNIGMPNTGVGNAAGGSGNFVNVRGDGTAGSLSTTNGVVNNATLVVPTAGAPAIHVNGNVDNDGDMDLSGGDVQVFGNVDNDGDMDLSGGDVQVFRAGAPANVNNGVTNPNATININTTTLNIGMPNTGRGNAAGGSGTFNNDAGGVANGTVGPLGIIGGPSTVGVNGNVDNDGDMDLSGGDVQVFGNVDNDGDMDLSGGDVQVFRAAPGSGGTVTNGTGGTILLAPAVAPIPQTVLSLEGDLTNNRPSGGVTTLTSTPNDNGSIIIFNGDPSNNNGDPQNFTPGVNDYHNVQVGTTTPTAVSSNVTVTGDLRITDEVRVDNGDITTDAGAGNTVTLIGNAVLTGENTTNSLNGRVVNEQNMGTNTSESFGGNLGITILNPRGIDLGVVTVRRFTGLGAGTSFINTSILTDRQSIDAVYQIESSRGSTIGGGSPIDTVQIRFNWQSSQDNNVDLVHPGSNSVFYSTSTAVPVMTGWVEIPNLTVRNANDNSTTLNTDARTLTVTTNHFSLWTPGGFVIGVLAVEWVEANAYLIPNAAPAINGTTDAVQIDWATSLEQYVDHFAIEHSTDGRNYQEVGTVESAHHSTDLNTYSFVHDRPENSLNYYRIKVYDMDGGQSFSRVMTVSVSKEAPFTLTYPNPMAEGDVVNLYLRQDAEVHAQLFTVDGHLLGSCLDGNLKGGQAYKAAFPVAEMAQGVYLLKLNVNGEIQAHRIVIE